MKKKNNLLFLLLFICLLMMTACNNANSNNNDKEISTGTPTGIIEQPQVMYNNTIYYYTADGRDEDLPDGYILVGEIVAINSEKSPEENYYGSGLDIFIGQEIYSNPDISDVIFLKYDSGFAKFVNSR